MYLWLKNELYMTDNILEIPRQTLDLVGHDTAEQTLLAAALFGRLAHAWLLAGPPGVGKETLAYRFARFLLAGGAGQGDGLFGDKPTSLAIDAQHPVTRRVAAGGHGDLLTVGREMTDSGKLRRDLTVEAVRRIHPFLSLTPAEGGWRVVILDEAHTMNRNAANAVLKVLEEPPKRAILLMTATNPGALLPTIRSRVRRLDLDPIAPDLIVPFLTERRPDVTGDQAGLLARLSDGAPGQALRLFDEGALDTYADVRGLLEQWPRFDHVALHKLSDQLGAVASDIRYRQFVAMLDRMLGDTVRSLANVPDREGGPGGAVGVGIMAGQDALVQRMGAGGGVDRWLAVWEKTRALVARTDQANLDRRHTILQTFLTLEAAGSPA